jgi:[ribosomal protein S5]-alanine N-acetyltransferase
VLPSSELRTARLLLRRLTVRDADALLRTTGDPQVMRYWAPGPDRGRTEAARRIDEIERHWVLHGFGDWAVIEKATRELIGFAGLHYIADMPEPNVGYAFQHDRWGIGYGSEVCRRLVEWGLDVLRLPAIVAVIDPGNAASMRVAEASGLSRWKTFTWSGLTRVAYIVRAAR